MQFPDCARRITDQRYQTLGKRLPVQTAFQRSVRGKYEGVVVGRGELQVHRRHVGDRSEHDYGIAGSRKSVCV